MKYNVTLVVIFMLCLAAVIAQQEETNDQRQKRLAATAASAAIRLGMDLLGNISNHYYNNEAMVCYWNDWKARDARAHIERTFRKCRFSRAKRTWGIVNGRWYCTMKQAACKALGHRLDK
ncbi:uncharacterized protein LOC141911352 [Tubulanus polymorphus]|uniref:uncharacterized protein LOC141911352 n=1 Tax=Tubulanus polymorphus TaxID=672921 RepID=UPI003DA55B0E